MGETKRRILQFAFYDKTGIQTYLEKQAAQGLLSDAGNPWAAERELKEDADVQRVLTDLRGSGEDAAELPALLYTVTEVKAPFLNDWCLEKIIDADAEKQDIDGKVRITEMRRTEEEPWGADAAYRLYVDGDEKRKYVVCYGNVILELDASWELTGGQMAVVGEKFGRAKNG